MPARAQPANAGGVNPSAANDVQKLNETAPVLLLIDKTIAIDFPLHLRYAMNFNDLKLIGQARYFLCTYWPAV